MRPMHLAGTVALAMVVACGDHGASDSTLRYYLSADPVTLDPALSTDVQSGEVETVDVERATVHDHHLAVIAHEIVGGARHCDARLEEQLLQLAQTLGAAAIQGTC